MNDKIAKILHKSTFKVEPGKFMCITVSEVTESGKHFLLARDGDEITVITKAENSSGLKISNSDQGFSNLRLIAINISNPVSAVGFLAGITQAMAKADINILVVSTYSKDHILIEDSKIEAAKSAFLKLGLQEVK